MRSTKARPRRGDAQGSRLRLDLPMHSSTQRLQRIQEPLGRNVSRPRLPRPTTVDFSQRIDIKHRMHDAQDITHFMSCPANAMHSLGSGRHRVGPLVDGVRCRLPSAQLVPFRNRSHQARRNSTEGKAQHVLQRRNAIEPKETFLGVV